MHSPYIAPSLAVSQMHFLCAFCGGFSVSSIGIIKGGNAISGCLYFKSLASSAAVTAGLPNVAAGTSVTDVKHALRPSLFAIRKNSVFRLATRLLDGTQ